MLVSSEVWGRAPEMFETFDGVTSYRVNNLPPGTRGVALMRTDDAVPDLWT